MRQKYFINESQVKKITEHTLDTEIKLTIVVLLFFEPTGTQVARDKAALPSPLMECILWCVVHSISIVLVMLTLTSHVTSTVCTCTA